MKSLKRKILHNKKGFSAMELMVGLAIGAIVIVSANKLILKSKQEESRAKTKYEVSNVKRMIATRLFKNDFCEQIIRGNGYEVPEGYRERFIARIEGGATDQSLTQSTGTLIQAQGYAGGDLEVNTPYGMIDLGLRIESQIYNIKIPKAKLEVLNANIERLSEVESVLNLELLKTVTLSKSIQRQTIVNQNYPIKLRWDETGDNILDCSLDQVQLSNETTDLIVENICEVAGGTFSDGECVFEEPEVNVAADCLESTNKSKTIETIIADPNNPGISSANCNALHFQSYVDPATTTLPTSLGGNCIVGRLNDLRANESENQTTGGTPNPGAVTCTTNECVQAVQEQCTFATDYIEPSTIATFNNGEQCQLTLNSATPPKMILRCSSTITLPAAVNCGPPNDVMCCDMATPTIRCCGAAGPGCIVGTGSVVNGTLRDDNLYGYQASQCATENGLAQQSSGGGTACLISAGP
jgi:prepilin-type N-terminal cleavage/methylation domain-containing protein